MRVNWDLETESKRGELVYFHNYWFKRRSKRMIKKCGCFKFNWHLIGMDSLDVIHLGANFAG